MMFSKEYVLKLVFIEMSNVSQSQMGFVFKWSINQTGTPSVDVDVVFLGPRSLSEGKGVWGN